MHLLVHEQRWTVCRKGTLVESNQGSLFASQRVITLMCLVTEPVVISCLDFFCRMRKSSTPGFRSMVEVKLDPALFDFFYEWFFSPKVALDQ